MFPNSAMQFLPQETDPRRQHSSLLDPAPKWALKVEEVAVESPLVGQMG
jgi:hypothetical protein